MTEAYFYAPNGRASAHSFAEVHNGKPGLGHGVLESFVLTGSDPNFPGAPSGAWCIVTDGTAPPPGFQPVVEPSAAAAACSTMAEISSHMQNIFSRLAEGLADLDVSAFS